MVQPLLCPLSECDATKAGVKPVTTYLVSLDGMGKTGRIRLAQEVAGPSVDPQDPGSAPESFRTDSFEWMPRGRAYRQRGTPE